MLGATDHCLIWRTPASVEFLRNDSFRVHSPRTGGAYVVSRSTAAGLKNLDEVRKARLTSWLIRNRVLGTAEPQIPYELAQGLRSQSTKQRAGRLLQYIESNISYLGDVFEFETHSTALHPDLASHAWLRFAEMLAWSESTRIEELRYLLFFLHRQGFLEPVPGGATLVRYNLTVEGTSYLAELGKPVSDSTQAFVAMWFDDSMNDVWRNGIKPAIIDAGYYAMRIDEKESLNRIDDEIIAEIRRSRFLVADFTEGDSGARGGVYYEAGFAHGLNIPVIFTCRKDAIDKLHFDTRQYPHIVWSSPEELRSLLAKRISAVLGDGPHQRTKQNP